MPLVEGEYMKKYDIIFAGWGAGSVASVYFFAFLYEKWNQINN
ncbi:hypothetical protein N8Z90_01375 [Crocinitomicaceae bacterium]|jgi:hypothetical protein|nr:hypothetical protein [Crocinitomicaceae bacterium]